ncbi:MAG: DUF6134 family protein [Kiloniellales bacterium]
MNRRFLLALPLLLLTGLAKAEDLPQPPAGDYVYAIDVSGRGKVGAMTITLKRSGEETQARVHRKIQVKVLGITAYRNESTVTQTLKAGKLTALDRQTNDDGDRSSLKATLSGDRLDVSDGSKTWTVDATLLPTSPWNPDLLSRSALLDTKTGKAVDITTADKGQEELLVAGHRLKARRFEQRGGDSRDLWFDDKGRLVRMVLHREGNTVTMALESAP